MSATTSHTAAKEPSVEADLAQIREWVLEHIGGGHLEEAIDLLLSLLDRLRQDNDQLRLQLTRWVRSTKKSEAVSADQLDFFLKLLGQPNPVAPSSADSAATESNEAETAESSPESEPQAAPPRRQARPHGRKPLPAHLPRRQQLIPVAQDERVCPLCGHDRTCIGHEKSEILEYVPGHFEVIELLREKLACSRCGEGVATAPPAAKVIEGGLPGPGTLAEVVMSKYGRHEPLNRQHERYKQLGVEIARSTLSGWVGFAADELEPVARLIRDYALSSYVLGTDASGIQVLDQDHPTGIKKGSMWCYVGDERYVFFDYAPTGEQEPMLQVLKDRRGYIQADASNIYDALFRGSPAKAIEVGCWMHARRNFVTALDGGELRAAIAIQYIREMYEVEADLKSARAGPDETLRVRQERSLPVVKALEKWVSDTYQTEPPGSKFQQSLGYVIRQGAALERYLADGRLNIDNGYVERAIRDLAVGRRNYLFAGSDTGAERAAVMYSVIGTCKLNGVQNIWAYLRDVLQKLAEGWPNSKLAELLPDAWAAHQPAQSTED